MAKLDPAYRTQVNIGSDLPDGVSKVSRKIDGFDRLYKTDKIHTYIIMPKESEQDMREAEADMNEIFSPQPQPVQPPPARRSRKKSLAPPPPEPQPARINVQAELSGFGTVPTRYSDFDEGTGCLRLGICEDSWIPPRAETDEDGNITGSFSFTDIPGKRWLNIGLEFTSRGRRNIILIQAR